MPTVKANGAKKPAVNRIDAATREAAWDELIRLRIRGATQKQAADMLGFHYKTIEGWEAKPAYKLKFLRTKKLIFERTQDVVEEKASQAVVEVEQLIAQYSTEAITKIRDKMTSSANESIQLKAAIDLADRGPRTSKTKKTSVTGVMAFLTPELLAAAARTAKELNEDRAVGRECLPVELDPIMAEAIDDDSDVRDL